MRSRIPLMIPSIILFFCFPSCITEKEIVEREASAVQSDSLQIGREGSVVHAAAMETIADTSLIIPAREVRADLSALKSFDSKYPFEVKLLKNKALQIRLKKLLGAELFNFVKRISQVESPIEIEDGLFYAWGMQAHSGGDPSAVIMVDFNKDVVYVGIRRDKSTKIYSEDGQAAPQKLREWASQPYFEDLLEAGVFN